jgi:hypothetical protein
MCCCGVVVVVVVVVAAAAAALVVGNININSSVIINSIRVKEEKEEER